MESTFGNSLLAVNQIIDGKTLSYAYCNRTMPDKMRTLLAHLIIMIIIS